jgi:hypothetical protein
MENNDHILYPVHYHITKEDVKDVASNIGAIITEPEAEWALACYQNAQRQDPTGTWNLVVENLIYQLLNMRDDRELYDNEIFGEDASTDDCFFNIEE